MAKKQVNPLLQRLQSAQDRTSRDINNRNKNRNSEKIPDSKSKLEKNPLYRALNGSNVQTRPKNSPASLRGKSLSRSKAQSNRVQKLSVRERLRASVAKVEALNSQSNSSKQYPNVSNSTGKPSESRQGGRPSTLNSKLQNNNRITKHRLTLSSTPSLSASSFHNSQKQQRDISTRDYNAGIELSYDPQSPSFLTVRNLEVGTSADDLIHVFEKIGKVTGIRVKDLASGSATAEIMFTKHRDLVRAYESVKGSFANGRLLQADITTNSQFTS